MNHQPGDIVSKTFYARVQTIDVASVTSMLCADVRDHIEFLVRGDRLIDEFISADRYGEEQELTKTELATRFVDVGALPFTVSYTKARGQQRVLRGKLIQHEDLLGRSLVHDFDVQQGSPLREVDHRTLQWLIVNHVKYTLKGK